MTHQITAEVFSPPPPMAPGPAGLPPHYMVHYHAGMVNHCPGCAGTHWFVGRTMAQCARCETALPLARIAETPMHPLFVTRGCPRVCAA